MGRQQVLIIEPATAPHVPTSESRDLVCRAVACGLDDLEIAFMLGLEPLKLRQHYRDELDHGTAFYVARVGSAMIDSALRGDVNAQRTFVQARGRWTMPTGEEARRAVDKSTIEARKTLMDSILSKVKPAAESSKEKVSAKPNNRQ